jgi:monoamine oxidase
MQNKDRSVIVIGAGLAGLAAALDLHRAGWKVIVLEARERVGGRVHSIRNFSNGLVAEGGGEFIDAHHAHMLALVREFNLSLGEVGSWQGQGGDWGAYEGKAGPLSDVNTWGLDLRKEIDRIWNAVSQLGRQVADPSNPLAAPKASMLDERSAAQWIDEQSAHPLARIAFRQHIRAEYTCEPENFSLLDLARNASLYYEGAHDWGTNYRIIGGNDLLPAAIANELPDLRLSAIVASIQIQPEKVVIKYRQGDSFHTLEASFAVLAIPLTTARLIDFHASLPTSHQQLVNELSYGAVTKVMIEYRRRFWHERGWNGRLSTDLPIVYTWEATSHLEGEHGILTVYTGGGPGAKLSGLSDEERIKTAASVIEKIFPGSSALIEDTATTAWVNEPFTRGSYMAFAPGEVTRHWKALFTPAGRLYFAGEHATIYQGFMEGAVESGQSAAKNIMECI